MSPKNCFYFFLTFAGNYFQQRQIFANFKPDSGRSLGPPLPTFPFPGRVMRESILRRIMSKPQYYFKRWSTSAQSIAIAQRARFYFAAKKA